MDDTKPSRVFELSAEIPMEKTIRETLSVFVRRVRRIGSDGFEMDTTVSHERFSHLGRVVDGQWRPVSMSRCLLTLDEQTRVLDLAASLQEVLARFNA